MADEVSYGPSPPTFLPREALGDLVRALIDEAYTVIGPVRRDGAITMRPITDADQIASGVRDEQSGGRYRLVPNDEACTFEYVVGPDGAKRYFFPPERKLFSLHVEGERFVLDAGPEQPPKLAFIGLRPCDLAAIAVQDRVFGVAADQQTFRCESETYYRQSRERAMLIAVNCTNPGGTCFCESMGTGPVAREGFDVSLTELRSGFVARAGTEAGATLLDALPTREPAGAELELEELKLQRAREHMGRAFDTEGVKELLAKAVEHPHWDEVAHRCLGCANCTMVCPTCFCSTVVDTNDLSDGSVTRTRHWESCYTHQFSYTTAGPVRNSIRGRYRQWLRHKLSTWWDQFGTSGCVGCGRCITWCPVGIDLTKEVEAIRTTAPHEPRDSRIPIGIEVL